VVGPAAAAASPMPVLAKPATMPRDDRLRLHEDERLPPARPEAGHPNPEQAISGAQRHSTSAALPLEDEELVPQHEQFHVERRPARTTSPSVVTIATRTGPMTSLPTPGRPPQEPQRSRCRRGSREPQSRTPDL
jgi:hypothetical protein